MKKRVFGRKFSRGQKARRALLRSLAREFILRGGITTTLARAKTLKPVIDKLVTTAKKGNISAKRSLYAYFFQDRQMVGKLEEEVKSRFDILESGFTKTVRVGNRLGDNSPMIKLVWSREKRQVGQLEKSSTNSKVKKIEAPKSKK